LPSTWRCATGGTPPWRYAFSAGLVTSLTAVTAGRTRSSGAIPQDFLRQSYGEVSPDGIGHYGVVVAKLDTMHAHEPSLTHQDLVKITCRTLVTVGDDDEVRLEHAVDLYRSLTDAELCVVPGTSHGLPVEQADLCNMVITEFFTKDRYRPSRPSICIPVAGPRSRRAAAQRRIADVGCQPSPHLWTGTVTSVIRSGLRELLRARRPSVTRPTRSCWSSSCSACSAR
jgi:hypothetical protein